VSGDLGQKKELVASKRRRSLRVPRSRTSSISVRSSSTTTSSRRCAPARCTRASIPWRRRSVVRFIARALVEVARAEGCDAVAHGCTERATTRCAFEAAVAALAPDMRVFAPVRSWSSLARGGDRYCRVHGIPVSATLASPYSIDENLWAPAIECGMLEDPTVEPPADAYQRTVSRRGTGPPGLVTIEFEQGIPVALNGTRMDGVSLIDALNDMRRSWRRPHRSVENRLVGIKSREIYEAPAAHLIVPTSSSSVSRSIATPCTTRRRSRDYPT